MINSNPNHVRHHLTVSCTIFVLLLVLIRVDECGSSKVITLPAAALPLAVPGTKWESDDLVIHSASPAISSEENAHSIGVAVAPVPARNPRPISDDAPAELRGLPCIVSQIENYEYSVCPYSNVTQRDIQTGWQPFWGILGIYDSWEVDIAVPAADDIASGDVTSTAPVGKSYLFQHYTDGTVCGSTPRRCAVSWRCREEAAVLAVSEPSTCQYAIVVASPHVCGSEAIQGINDGENTWTSVAPEGPVPAEAEQSVSQSEVEEAPAHATPQPTSPPSKQQCAETTAAQHTRELMTQASLRILRCALQHASPVSPAADASDASQSLAGMLGGLQQALFGDKAPLDAATVPLLGLGQVLTEDGSAQAVKAASRQSQLQADLAAAKAQIAKARAGHRHIPNVEEFMQLARRVSAALKDEDDAKAMSNRQRMARLVASNSNLQEGLMGDAAPVGALAEEYACGGVLSLDSDALGRPPAVLAAAQARLAELQDDLVAAMGPS